MPKTETPDRLFFLSGSKNIHRFLVLLLALAATLVVGQESALTLALVRYDQPSARKPAVTRNGSTTDLLCYDTSVPRLRYQAAAVRLDAQNAADYPSDSCLEKQSGVNQRDLFQFVHKKLYADGRAGVWVDVAAGYGQICGVKSDIWKNSAELEQPGCAYLKASFSF